MVEPLLLLLAGVSLASADLFVYPEVFNKTNRDRFVFGNFPQGFRWGSATASYQVEGAWNVGGRGMTIWDTWSQTPGNVHNDQTGDDACKSYYKVDDDIRNLQTLGVDYYRFSIAWSRILPNGLKSGGINQPGVQYYNDTINKLLAAGLQPMVTLYHWDLPQNLEDMGGQIAPQFPQWFADYATICFQLFGDRVKLWISVNEPQTVAGCYEYDSCAPGVYSPGVDGYKVIHQHLLAHQTAYHIYNDQFKPTQGGQFGIVIVSGWSEPATYEQKDVYAAWRSNQFGTGWLLSPLLKTGNYPEVMITAIANASAQQGYSESRLPVFTEEEQKLLLGATDFVGLNYYTGRLASYMPFVPAPTPSMSNDQSVYTYAPEDWPTSACDWLLVMPYAIRHMLQWVQAEYGGLGIPFYITENGFCAQPDPIPCQNTLDVDKSKYLLAHINQVYRAVAEDGVNLLGYTLWSLMDNFEWADGYSKNFGVYCTNFADPDRWRTPRYSASLFHKIVANNGFVFQDDAIGELKKLGILAES